MLTSRNYYRTGANGMHMLNPVNSHVNQYANYPIKRIPNAHGHKSNEFCIRPLQTQCQHHSTSSDKMHAVTEVEFE
uniref:Ovule protein n=1 Tax=Brugia timori TaxID=42155 RepID=A0A0R3Q9A4_9BILA